MLYQCAIGGESPLLGEEAELKVWISPKAALRIYILGMSVCPLAVELAMSSATKTPAAG